MVDRFSSPLLLALSFAEGVPFSRVHFQVPYSLDFLVGCLEKVPRIFSQMLGFTVMHPMVESATKSPSTNKSLRL